VLHANGYRLDHTCPWHRDLDVNPRCLAMARQTTLLVACWWRNAITQHCDTHKHTNKHIAKPTHTPLNSTPCQGKGSSHFLYKHNDVQREILQPPQHRTPTGHKHVKQTTASKTELSGCNDCTDTGLPVSGTALSRVELESCLYMTLDSRSGTGRHTNGPAIKPQALMAYRHSRQ
jgi:hypothetical protein